MATLIAEPTIVKAAGNLPKVIRELVGRVNSNHQEISIAHMSSPAGWVEPGQTPEFDEYTFVMDGTLRVESRDTSIDVGAGQLVIAHAGDWVRYSTPTGADYLAICVPAFSPDTVHRDAE